MAFAGISYIAVIAAGIAGFAFGAVYYMTLGKQWMAALGKTEAELRGEGIAAARPFVIAALAQLVMAFMLAGLMGHLGEAGVTPLNGLLSGLFVWVGFVVTTMAVNHSFQGAAARLTMIDGAHWLGVLALQGLVIGTMGL